MLLQIMHLRAYEHTMKSAQRCLAARFLQSASPHQSTCSQCPATLALITQLGWLARVAVNVQGGGYWLRERTLTNTGPLSGATTYKNELGTELGTQEQGKALKGTWALPATVAPYSEQVRWHLLRSWRSECRRALHSILRGHFASAWQW